MDVTESQVMFEMGAILLVAFIGSALAIKGRQSVILGYIVAGILIGPFIHIQIGPLTYDGVIHDTSFIESVSQIGLILLIFFVGLEFSISKIKRVKGPAVILSLIDVGLNIFTGLLLAAGLGWPLIDSIFLAAVLAMSCSAVAMKTLMELNRLDKPETEYLMGMVILEEFISMVFLTVVGGLIIKLDANFTLEKMAFGIGIFFAFFAILAVFIIPKTVSSIQKIKSDETFILFVLGVVILSAALAEACGVPAMIGAFFIGMAFAETKVTERMEKKVEPLRDAFVAIFFVSFGMFIDPMMFPSVVGIIMIGVVVVIVDEIFLMSAVAYLVGFSRRAATSIGASFSARGGESIMYASVGANAAGATRGAELLPVAGAVTFIMSAACPFFIKKSDALADYLARRMPRFLKYGASLTSRTLNKLVVPGGMKFYKSSRTLLILLAAFLILVIGVAATGGMEHVILFAATMGVVIAIWFVLQQDLLPTVKHGNYSNLGTSPGHYLFISRFVAAIISLTLVLVCTMAFLFVYYWPLVFVVAVAYLAWLVYMMKVAYDLTCDVSKYCMRSQPGGLSPLERSQRGSDITFTHRDRWKGM